MATSTPWGTADYTERYARGIIWYGTPSHGGFHVCKTLNEQIPEYMRDKGGWYEEDCDWSIVATIFPGVFIDHEGVEKAARSIAHAQETLRNWRPDAYEQFYGVELKPGESYIRDARARDPQHP